MFVELKCKSNFSFLNGASDSREYIVRASELRMPAIAITDINGVYSIPRAWEIAKNIPNFKLIIGAELKLSDHPNISLISRDRGAYAVLCKILTRLHSGKVKGKGSLRLSELIDEIEKDIRSKNLIAIPNFNSATALGTLKEIFDDRVYLPLCQYLDGLDGERIEKTLTASKSYDIPIVGTNDVYYHHPSRKMLQDSLTCIREGVSLQTAGRRIFKNKERYLKSPLQMRALFRDIPNAIRSTLDIADSCNFRISELKYTYPQKFIPNGYNAQEYLEELVFKGAQQTYKGIISKDVDDQIRKELKLIGEKSYSSYFLTIYDIVQFARSKNIICQGRGSAANSITCYCLGITAIDPIRMGLLFERFISEGRDEPPDIDVDFEHEQREIVIQFIYDRYGRDNAAMVSAVRTYQEKSAFLEISKAFGISIGNRSSSTLARDFQKLAGSLSGKQEMIKLLASDLQGFPRHLSIHSGGFTISHNPIAETVPIEPARKINRSIIQWDKNDLDTVGLLKLDILSLGFLTVLRKTCNYIGIDWKKIPPEDQATYDMICRGDTIGTFQIESRAQISMLPRTKPRTFYDLVVQVAIVRPGPGMGSMIKPYLERRNAARNGIRYELPDQSLESILGRTYGVPIFQEMVMKLAILKAGFTSAEADELRKSIAAVRSVISVDKIGRKLKLGLMKSGLPEKWIEEVCGYFSGFAHYNFPESHAASFAIITYASAYLKCHHPAELLCGLINSQPMGFYAIDTLINDAKRNGVKILPINPNLSVWEAVIEGPKTVRMGFCNVRKIREEDVRWMSSEHEREINNSDFKTHICQNEIKKCFLIIKSERSEKYFDSVYNFIIRTKFSREVIELMAMANVFSCFGQDQRHSFWQSLTCTRLFHKSSSNQLPLFSKDPSQNVETPIFQKMSLSETILADYKALGYSTNGNIMLAFRKTVLKISCLTSTQVKDLKKGSLVSFAGVLSVLQRPPTARGVAFITLEDEEGSVDVIIKKSIYEQFEAIIKNSRFLLVDGTVQRDHNYISILLSKVESFVNLSPVAKSVDHGTTSRIFENFTT